VKGGYNGIGIVGVPPSLIGEKTLPVIGKEELMLKRIMYRVGCFQERKIWGETREKKKKKRKK